jgi:hypothetical protein
VVPNRYIVTFLPEARLQPGILSALTAQHGLQVRHTFDNVFDGFSAVIPDAALPALPKARSWSHRTASG